MRFSAVIGKTGVNPCVDVPSDVSTALGRTGYVPVVATLNGHRFRSGLVSLGGGRHRLYVNGAMRKTAGIDVGDHVEIAVEYDPKPRRRPVPEQLSAALDADPVARKRWEALTPSRRNEMLDYLNSLKRPASIERTVEKIVRAAVEDSRDDSRSGD